MLDNILTVWQQEAKTRSCNITLVQTHTKLAPQQTSATSRPINCLTTRLCSSKIILFSSPMNCQTDSGTKTAKVKTKHKHFTCEAKGAPAGIPWGGRGLTHCNACGAIQTAVWFYQAGVLNILAKLPDPSWGTSALEERGMIFKICGRNVTGYLGGSRHCKINTAHRGMEESFPQHAITYASLCVCNWAE